MAGDWIPFTKELPRKPEVLRITAITGRPLAEVVLTLLEFWAWVDGESEDGSCRASVALLSHVCRAVDAQFVSAMCAVGWLRIESGPEGDVITVPNFSVWMGLSAKKRLRNTQRQRTLRLDPASSPAAEPVAHKARQKRDRSATTGQDRTKKKNTPLPPNLDTDAFRAAWEAWRCYRREARKPLTPSTEEAQYKRLSAWGEERAIAAIAHSIASGWQGIFEGNSNGTHRVGRDPSRVEAPAGKYDHVGIKASSDPPPEPAAPAAAPADDPAAGLFGPGCGVERDPGDF